MLPILQETNEMEKLKQLNSILVKELKDSKNEIAKLKGENDILKEKYEEMRGNIKKLISPEDMELKIGHSVDEKSFSLQPFIYIYICFLIHIPYFTIELRNKLIHRNNLI